MPAISLFLRYPLLIFRRCGKIKGPMAGYLRFSAALF